MEVEVAVDIGIGTAVGFYVLAALDYDYCVYGRCVLTRNVAAVFEIAHHLIKMCHNCVLSARADCVLCFFERAVVDH